MTGAYRSYEVKHACYGGTVALRQALEWRWSGAHRGKAALVIAADVARYTPGGPAEPTQGAGAVAMIVDDGQIAAVDRESYTWARPAFDFWRPVGNPWPEVAGKLSLDCYNEATVETFRQLLDGRPAADVLDSFAAIAMHVPFPRMVRKAFGALGEACGLDPDHVARLFERRVLPALTLHPKVGNSYTASLWMGVATGLAGRAAGERLAAFSYGSGFGAELLTLTAGPGAAAAPWMEDVAQDLRDREVLSAAAYDAEREAERARYA
jgi:hydroxymethylglutaryl-CoA synthase